MFWILEIQDSTSKVPPNPVPTGCRIYMPGQLETTCKNSADVFYMMVLQGAAPPLTVE